MALTATVYPDTQKRMALLGLMACAVLAGIFAGLDHRISLSVHRLLDIGLVVACLAFIFLWVHVDSDQVRFKRSKALNAGILVLPLVFFPLYLVRSRDSSERAVSILKAAAFLVALATVGITSEFAIAFLSM